MRFHWPVLLFLFLPQTEQAFSECWMPFRHIGGKYDFLGMKRIPEAVSEHTWTNWHWSQSTWLRHDFPYDGQTEAVADLLLGFFEFSASVCSVNTSCCSLVLTDGRFGCISGGEELVLWSQTLCFPMVSPACLSFATLGKVSCDSLSTTQKGIITGQVWQMVVKSCFL